MQPKQNIVRNVGIILVAALALFSISCRHSDSSDRADRMIRYLTDELSLTEAQQAMLVGFKEEMAQRRAAKEERRDAARAILMEEVQKDAMDQERLLDLYRAAKPRMDELAEYVVSSMAEFHASLSPEQKTKLIEKLQNIEKWKRYFVD